MGAQRAVGAQCAVGTQRAVGAQCAAGAHCQRPQRSAPEMSELRLATREERVSRLLARCGRGRPPRRRHPAARLRVGRIPTGR